MGKEIGIDVGHCETAFAMPRMIEDQYQVIRLSASNNDNVIVTQIILTNEQMKALKGKKSPTFNELEELSALHGDFKIGNNLPAAAVNGEKFIYFKVPPKDFDTVCAKSAVGKECGITHGVVIACYVYALTKLLLKHNVGSCSEDDRSAAQLLVGCPTTSDWTLGTNKEAYAQLIQRATKVESVRIIPESRAAMFSSIENGKNMVSAANGALVFDFGSSTADCTYMLLGQKILEFSWTLGASEIESTMTRLAYKEAQKNQKFNATPESFLECDNYMREAKESYYSGAFGSNGHPMFGIFKKADGEAIYQPIIINDDFMNKVVGEEKINILCDSTNQETGSWHSLCEKFFKAAKEALKKENAPIGTIVLTGGASKMNFIYELCGEVFKDIPKLKIILETNPSHTVSNGLGWVSLTDRRVAECKKDAIKDISTDDSCQASALKYNLLDAIYKIICKIVNSEATRWANLDGQHTTKELYDSIAKEIKSKNFEIVVKCVAKDEIEKWRCNLSDKVKDAVNKQAEKLYSQQMSKAFIVPNEIWTDLSKITDSYIDIEKIAETVKNFDVMTFFQAVVILILCMVNLFTGGLFDNVLSNLWNKIENRGRGQSSRRRFADNLRNEFAKYATKEKILEECAPKLDEALKDYDKVIDDLLTKAFEIITLKRFDTK